MSEQLHITKDDDSPDGVLAVPATALTPQDDRGFTVKDSGQRQEFAGGMVRDTTEGKTHWHRVADGPMLRRWAEHLTKGADKYPDVEPGKPNWTLANGEEEYQRFKQSAFRHFFQWYIGNRDEDHAAAVLFNINGAEYVREKLDAECTDPKMAQAC